MRESHKSKRVSWASDVNLCQVRLFLSEESPSQAGLNSQDHLQAKTSWLSHSPATPSTDDVLPPGFEAPHPANQLQAMVSQIPAIKWKCPPKLLLEVTWQVVAGEESNEIGIQNQREMRVLEAVYPRPSAIPPNPSVTLSSEDLSSDHTNIPWIPLTPIEDEDASADAHSEQSSMLQNIGTGLENRPASDNFLAAALTGLANSNDQGNMIDRELLLKILNNPRMVERLATDYGAASATNTTTQNNSQPISRPGVTLPIPQNVPGGPLYPQPNGASIGQHQNSRPSQFPSLSQQANNSVPGQPSSSGDMNYFKNLIHQHGGERQEPPQQYSNTNNRYNNQPGTNQEPLPMNGLKPRGELKPKMLKPCIYFNSSRGCRHGANCSYQHDASYQHRGGSMPEGQSAKRTKFDREISS